MTDEQNAGRFNNRRLLFGRRAAWRPMVERRNRLDRARHHFVDQRLKTSATRARWRHALAFGFFLGLGHKSIHSE